MHRFKEEREKALKSVIKELENFKISNLINVRYNNDNGKRYSLEEILKMRDNI